MMHRLQTWLLGRSELVEPLVWLQRRETWYADIKTNSIRLLTLALFTVSEFIAYTVLHSVDRGFHIAAVTILLLWWAAAGLFHGAVRRHILARRLPYVSVLVDLLFLTALLALGEGTHSSLVVIYFLIVALSGIRLNPLLSLFSATGACFFYLLLFAISGGQWSSVTQTALHATVIPLALMLMGIIISNWIRRVIMIINEMMKERPV